MIGAVAVCALHFRGGLAWPWFALVGAAVTCASGAVARLVLRPSNYIGSGQAETFVVASLAGQIARIERGLAPPYLEVGDLSAGRDFFDVADLTTAFGDKAPSRATVFRCFYEFRSGRTSFEDEQRSGRPRTALTPDSIAAVELMLREHCRTLYDTLQKTLDLDREQSTLSFMSTWELGSAVPDGCPMTCLQSRRWHV